MSRFLLNMFKNLLRYIVFFFFQKKCSIPAVLLLDEGLNRFDCIWALKQPDICKTLLPYVLGNKKYERLEKMMLANGSINQNDILTCKKLAVMSNESVVEYDEEEMLFE